MFDERVIRRTFPYIARSPPKLQLEKIELKENESTYSLFSYEQSEGINQDQPWNDDDFNQDLSW
ncbi:MAG: hypothetical protein ABIE74_05950 [Pseudomonadota bacterium]